MKECDLLIKGAHVYTPDDAGIADIVVKDGKICMTGAADAYSAREVIDGTGLIAMPGAIETHAHMLLPFGGTQTMNDFYTGTLAGAFGGVTTLIDFADQEKGKTAVSALDMRMEQALGKCVTDFSFHSTLTDITEETLQEIPQLIDRGITSFKFYTIYDNLKISYDDMLRAFRVLAKNNVLATVHAEDDDIVQHATDSLIQAGKTDTRYFVESEPDECERTAVGKIIDIVRETGASALIRHVSSAAGAQLIENAQHNGVPIYGETCPQYLYLTSKVYELPNGRDYIVHPPIRTQADQDQLWDTLQHGTVFTIGTDDCGFYLKQKHVSDKFYEVPGGLPGIETRVPILYELAVKQHSMGIPRFIELVSTAPAKLYGLYPQKGTLLPGSDADIVLFEPDTPTVISASAMHENSDYTPFEGFQTNMRIRRSIVRGKTITEDGTVCAEPGYGKWLCRNHPDFASLK